MRRSCKLRRAEGYLKASEISSVDAIKIYNACGKYNLNESADLVKNAKLIISHDTGLMHIAAAFKKTILSVWGNTVPSFGMAPYYGKLQVDDVNFPFPAVSLHRALCVAGHGCSSYVFTTHGSASRAIGRHGLG